MMREVRASLVFFMATTYFTIGAFMFSGVRVRRVGVAVLLAALFLSQVPASAGTRTSAVYAAPMTFAQSAFEATWRHTDAPVASGSVKRTWFWGPAPNSTGLVE